MKNPVRRYTDFNAYGLSGLFNQQIIQTLQKLNLITSV